MRAASERAPFIVLSVGLRAIFTVAIRIMFYADGERDMIMEGNRCVFIFFNLFIMISPYKCGNGAGKKSWTGGVWRSCRYFIFMIRFDGNGDWDFEIWGLGS